MKRVQKHTLKIEQIKLFVKTMKLVGNEASYRTQHVFGFEIAIILKITSVTK